MAIWMPSRPKRSSLKSTPIGRTFLWSEWACLGKEYWILDNRDQIDANVIFPVGALMDYRAGEIPTARRWLASLYLEWAYRLFSEPRRLWSRYLIEPWYVAAQVMRHYYLQKKLRTAIATDPAHNS